LRYYVARSPSEAFLLDLAERTFLKLWAVPNSFYAPNKELTDLIIPFGDDVIIISDKACRFDFDKPLNVAWDRWYRNAIQDSLRQLKTAMQRAQRAPDGIFTDVQARFPLPWPVALSGKPRFHLVAIARPDRVPGVIPPEWPGLRYVPAAARDQAFQIGKLELRGQQVHVFDGPTIDLLLDQINTAPDFIAYLTGRATRLAEADDYDFSERDLLGAALIGWEIEPTRLPSVPPLETVIDGLWGMYDSGDTARYRRIADRKSRIIDAYIDHTHGEFAAGRMLYDQPSYVQHEGAMRLLAAESRFARRVIAHELHDILEEPDQSTFWASTVPSPTTPSLRYVWLIYPKRPDDMSEAVFDRVAMEHLKQHVLVAQGLFPETLVLGICLPNHSAGDTAHFTVLHDGSNWTEADREEAMKLRDLGIFARLEANERVHIR
jgi:hypothetical protein